MLVRPQPVPASSPQLEFFFFFYLCFARTILFLFFCYFVQFNSLLHYFWVTLQLDTSLSAVRCEPTNRSYSGLLTKNWPKLYNSATSRNWTNTAQVRPKIHQPSFLSMNCLQPPLPNLPPNLTVKKKKENNEVVFVLKPKGRLEEKRR